MVSGALVAVYDQTGMISVELVVNPLVRALVGLGVERSDGIVVLVDGQARVGEPGVAGGPEGVGTVGLVRNCAATWYKLFPSRRHPDAIVGSGCGGVADRDGEAGGRVSGDGDGVVAVRVADRFGGTCGLESGRCGGVSGGLVVGVVAVQCGRFGGVSGGLVVGRAGGVSGGCVVVPVGVGVGGLVCGVDLVGGQGGQ